MNLPLKKFILPLFVVFLFVLFPVVVFAQSNPAVGNKIVTLGKDEVVDHDYFAAGNIVTLDGTVNGDAYVAGGQVDINGDVNGDLLVAGGQVVVRGKVSQNVRAAGGNVTIEGDVGRNVSAAGGNVVLDKAAQIGGNAALAGGNINVIAPLNDLAVAGGNVRIENNIAGNVTAGVGNLTILGDSTVKGNLDYWSANKATIATGSAVTGETNFHLTARPNSQIARQNAGRFLAGVSLFATVISFISSLIVGLLLLLFVPVYTQKTAELVRNKFWLSLLLGFVTLIVVPVAAVILMVTLVGIPIGLILLFSYFVALYFAKLFVALALGKYIASWAKWKWNLYWVFVFGLVCYFIVGMVPVIGFLMKLVVLIAGLGAVVMSKKYYFETLRSRKLI